jgi:signal transduction histidine kinase
MPAKDVKDATILVVDDQQANIDLLETFLTDDGYTDLVCTTDPRRAAALFEARRPDLVLLDLHMPHADGFAVMRELAALTPPNEYLPVLVLTADVNPESKRKALAGGAKDFLSKPLDETEVLLRIRNLLETRRLQQLNAEEAQRRAAEERRAALERVRTRIATDLHDDIAASLSRIALMSEVVKLQLGEAGAGGEAAAALSEIAGAAREVVDEMRDIVWSVDPARDDLDSVVLRVRSFAADVFKAKGVAWAFRVSPDAENLPLAPEQRRHLFLIFKEGIANIARHSGCASAELSIAAEGGRLTAVIADDGRGFTRAALPETDGRGGNGLPNMEERAARLGGTLHIDSRPGAGTRLTLSVPLDADGAAGRPG